MRWSPHVQDTGESEWVEHRQGLKRQPESTTEDLEDAGDQGDADDDDMNAIGAVCRGTRDSDPGMTVRSGARVKMVKGRTLMMSMEAFWILNVQGSACGGVCWTPQDAGELSRHSFCDPDEMSRHT